MLALLPSCGRAEVAAPPPSPSARLAPPTPTTAVTLPLITSPAGATGVVSGTVQINNGACCAGGVAGSAIGLRVAFSAASSAAVSDMRVGVGMTCRDDRLGSRPWEPFQSSKTYTTTLANNWVGWYIAAQYRDAQGSLSPIVCDDISLEGLPPTPAMP